MSENQTKAVKRKSNAGRKTLYRKEYDQIAHNYTLLGAGVRELALFFEVEPCTVERWKARHVSFRRAIVEGRDFADSKVAASIFRRATGYTQQEEKLFTVKGKVVRELVNVHYPADVSAGLKWLASRQSAKWSEKLRAEISGPDGAPIDTNMNLTVNFVSAAMKDREEKEDV